MRTPTDHMLKVQPATVAIISFGYFVISTAVLHFLNPAYSLVRSFAGNYDLGSYEFLIATTFFSLGLGCLVLTTGLYHETPRSPGHLAGLFFLGACGVSMLIAGIFPANQGGSTVPHMTTVLLAGIVPAYVEAFPETTFSFVHILALIGSLFCLSLAAFLLSWRFRQDEKWSPVYRAGATLALAMMAVSVLFCSIVFFPAYSSLMNPITLVVVGVVIGLLWLFLTAFWLHSLVAKCMPEQYKNTG
jgi:hypothetical protein